MWAVAALFLALLLFFLAYKTYPRPANGCLTLYGNVDVRQVDISFRVAGRVETLFFDEGDFVSKGAIMARLEKEPYSDKVDETLASIESYKASLQNAEEVYQRRSFLVADGAVSQEDYENALCNKETLAASLKEAEAAYRVAFKNLEDTVVRCPNDGVILTRIREPGSAVLETEPIFTLSLSDPIWVKAYISEKELGSIFPQMMADIFIDTPHMPVYKGHIGFISPVAEFTPKTVETLDLRTDLVYRLRIIVDNPDFGLKQGMPVTVKLYPRGNGSHDRLRHPHSPS